MRSLGLAKNHSDDEMQVRRNIELHVAGATVRHSSPYSGLVVPVSNMPLPADLRRKWVEPVYLNLLNLYQVDSKAIAAISPLVSEANEEVVLELLAQFDWRPRLVGAYLVALKRFTGLESTIGKLLLRSDLCYAAQGYCLALAELNSSAGVEYLSKYLDHYLGRVNLWFDQGNAMAAVQYLDGVNQTNLLAHYREAWASFVADKPYWSLDSSVQTLQGRLAFVRAVREASVG